jgi:uncharacterized protein YjiS (DUF1127 family)
MTTFTAAISNAFAAVGRFIRTVERARVAAQTAKDLYSMPAPALAALGLTRVDVPNYILRQLGVRRAETRPANDDAKIAA